MNPIKMIKASAGSGKTYRLMVRLSESIAGGTPPEQLLATTFTVKAAAELQSRIREKLLDKGKTEEAQRVFEGLIGTVNSVCGQILDQYAIEAGLPPQLDVIPEENATLIFEAAISRVIEKHAEKLNEVGLRLNLSPLKQNPHRKLPDWKDDVKTIVDLARSNNLSKEQLEQCAEDSCNALKTIFTASQKLSLDDIAARIKPCAEFKAEGKGTQDTIDKANSFLRSPTWHAAGSLSDSSYAKTKDQDFSIELLQSLQDELLSSQELYEDLCTMVRGVFACAAEALQEYDKYLKYAKKRCGGTVQYIFLGLDFGQTMGGPEAQSPLAPAENAESMEADLIISQANSPLHRIKTLLSADSLKYSLRNYDSYRKGSKFYYTRDNVKIHTGYTPKELDGIIGLYLDFYDKKIYAKYRYNDNYLMFLKKIKEDNPDTTIIAYTTPDCDPLMKVMMKHDLLDDYFRWLSDIVSVFGGCYNFMYPSTVTKNYYDHFHDTSHTNPHVGDMIADVIFNDKRHVGHDFGLYIDKHNFASRKQYLEELFRKL